MESCSLRSSRGQASIEFVFLLVIVLLLLQMVVLPHFLTAETVAKDIQTFSKARMAGSQLASAINEVASAGVGSRKTVSIVLTDRIYLECADASNWRLPSGSSVYPASWGSQRLSFNALTDYNEFAPPSLPVSENFDGLQPAVAGSKADYDRMVQNGGGCQQYPNQQGFSPKYLRCFGTIPVNVNCSAFASLADSIGLTSGVEGGRFYGSKAVTIVVEKESTGLTLAPST